MYVNKLSASLAGAKPTFTRTSTLLHRTGLPRSMRLLRRESPIVDDLASLVFRCHDAIHCLEATANSSLRASDRGPPLRMSLTLPQWARWR